MSIEEKIILAIEAAQEALDRFPGGFDEDGFDILDDIAQDYADDEDDYDMIRESIAVLV